jgi:hypothetical protein
MLRVAYASVKWWRIDELEVMWKEAIVTLLKVLSPHSPDVNEETHKYPVRIICIPAEIRTLHLPNSVTAWASLLVIEL